MPAASEIPGTTCWYILYVMVVGLHRAVVNRCPAPHRLKDEAGGRRSAGWGMITTIYSWTVV
jgi:hypothetical protein